MESSQVTYRGLDAIRLETEKLAAVIIPAWGGKIASLYDRTRKREWLHTNPHVAYRLPDYGANYVADFDAGGWDDCFPTVSPGLFPTEPWTHVQLPDHGEVWALPWQAELEETQVTLTVLGRQLPYRLAKTITVQGSRLRCDYRLENLAPQPLPFLWSSHPTFAVTPGMHLQIPAAIAWVNGGVGAFPAGAGDTIPWPHLGDWDGSVLPPRDAQVAAKLFFTALTHGAVTLADPADGSRCTLRFDLAQVPHVGVWMNFSAWAGMAGVEPYYNLAIEPCIGAADALLDAYAQGTAGLVQGHGERRWWMEVEVG